jgi:hypothetical protein
MKKISTFLRKNIYLKEVPGSIFLTYLDRLLEVHSLKKLKNKMYVHALIKYPSNWPADLDIFTFFKDDIVKLLQKRACFFIFDASAEGFDPIKENWFKLLYHSCEKNNISPNQIIFVSSNLNDEKNIKEFCLTTNKKEFNVFSFPMFEYDFSYIEDVDHQLNDAIKNSKLLHSTKYFSSLSRVNRQHRTIGTYLLCQSNIKNLGLISHNSLDDNFILESLIKRNITSAKDIKDWTDSLPLTVDQTNFNVNWALDTEFKHIHHQTIFQIVNETLADTQLGRSLFYSEKTFRPISCFQPFIIFGQVGSNHRLKDLGYKLYDEWFDLSFDFEEDLIIRYQKLLKVVEDTCSMLNAMDKDQRLKWKFKNQALLVHNVNTLKRAEYTVNKLTNFLTYLDSQLK